MRRILLAVLAALVFAGSAPAVVFINEVFNNPAGSADEFYEYVELQGTPGKRLDGYAIAFLAGTLRKFYVLNTIPPIPVVSPEIDEFFSLDGLSLGPNGLLVLTNDVPAAYPTILPDTTAAWWSLRWNGGLDTTGKIENDGSTTVLLVRNRPGATQADPGNPLGLRWGKDIKIDAELFTPTATNVCIGGATAGEPCRTKSDCLGATAVCGPGSADQLGDGNVDRGGSNNMGSFTLDLKGASTPLDLVDDLEIVDEVSWEHEQGWEYDFDARHVDDGSTAPGLPYRHVHALDDPQGLNPDCVTRVDYRTKGPGWTPAAGAIGEMPNGNNWPDTATAQWIRGESVIFFGPTDDEFYFSNVANADPNAVQPYETNVPAWLHDGVGADYDFSTANTYRIMAGRVNPLAVPFIPGDADRDGDCDADDIAKVAAVFGDADWVFSNSYSTSPETDGGDPATQTRPWDVDATGRDGIEASDLQWTLNFQGDTIGRVVGRQYDGSGPVAAGVVLNANAGVSCTVTTALTIPSGRPATSLRVGNLVELTVRGRVSSGANFVAGEQNGIMQFVHDLALSTGGVLQVLEIEKLGGFSTTRAALESPQGAGGDEGVAAVNGYATGFAAGLGADAPLYRVTLRAVGLGATQATVSAAAAEGMAASTPGGLKVGHTDHDGNPSAVAYPGAVAFAVTDATVTPGDADGDGDVDLDDYRFFGDCLTGPEGGVLAGCSAFNLDGDGDVDLQDFAAWARL